MKYFLKLNAVSSLYALMFFVPVELILNVYRISRLTNWDIGTINTLSGLTLVLVIIGGTFFFLRLTSKWLGRKKANYLSTILWIPYFILWLFAFAALFPITFGGDAPNPVTGLFIMGGLIFYPFYILILNLFILTNNNLPIETDTP